MNSLGALRNQKMGQQIEWTGNSVNEVAIVVILALVFLVLIGLNILAWVVATWMRRRIDVFFEKRCKGF